MKIIEINALDNGAHRNQNVSGVVPVPDGWAVIPEDIAVPGSFPFVDVETDGAGTVTKLTAREIPVEAPDLDAVKAEKIAEMSAACNAAITSGVDVTMNDGNTYHYSLTIEDQINLMNIQTMVANGDSSVPYHADGEECRYYSAEDFGKIAQDATEWKLYHESYFNSLRGYIQAMETVDAVQAVTYGMEIPAEYQTDVLKDLSGVS